MVIPYLKFIRVVWKRRITIFVISWNWAKRLCRAEANSIAVWVGRGATSFTINRLFGRNWQL